MNAIRITTENELIIMIIGVACFFLMGFGISYIVYRLQNKQKA